MLEVAPLIYRQVVTPHELMLWEMLRLTSPVAAAGADEVTALAQLSELTEDEVVVALGGLLARGLIRRMHDGTREWFLVLPERS